MKIRITLLFLLLSGFAVCQSYTYSTLAKFSRTSKTGSVIPLDLSMDSAGNFYGLAAPGKTTGYGLVWKVTPTGTLSVLYKFSTDAGFYDQTLAISGSYLYGMTSNLGIWKLNIKTKNLTVLSTASMTNGSLTLDTGGNIYGYDGVGDLFKLTPTGLYTILYTAVNGIDRPIIDKSGNCFGVGTNYGANASTYIWELTTAGHFTELETFAFGSVTSRLSQDNLGSKYGTLPYTGGIYDLGAIFKIDSAGAYTVLSDFDSYENGRDTTSSGYPMGPVVLDSAGNLYGTTAGSGIYGLPGSGTVWQFTTEGVLNALTLLPYFSNNVITMDKSGNIYGTIGSPSGSGAVYKLTKN